MASRKNTIKTNIEANSEGFIKAMDEVQRSVKTTRQEFKNINSIMDGTKDSTEQLIEHKKLLQTELTKTKKNLDILKEGLESSIKLNGEDSEATKIAREEVMKASTHYNNLKKELDLVNERLEQQTGILPKITNALDSVQNSTEKFSQKVKWLSVGAGSLLALGAKQAIDYEDAYVGVAKTVDGTDAELEQIRKDIISLSEKIPLATTEIFNLAETAGQLGIKAKDISKFTEIMSKLASATNLTAEEAGSKLATFVNIMNLDSDSYEKLGSVIVRLGNNSKATEKDIVNMSERIVGAAATLKMPAQSVLGLATALSSVGLEAEMGGTAISRILNDFNRAVNNVDTKYGTLSQYAKIAGMSTKQFAKTVKNDAGTALKEFIGGLGDTNRTGSSTIKLLEKLGVNEVRLTDTMLRMSNASGLLDEYLDMANEEWKTNTALTKEASTKFADTQSQVEIFKNKINNLASSLGQNLLPGINDILGKLSDLVNWFGQLDDKTKSQIVRVTEFTALLYPVSKGISSIAGNTKNLVTVTGKVLQPFKNMASYIKNADISLEDLDDTIVDNTKTLSKTDNAISENIKSVNNLKKGVSSLDSTEKEIGNTINSTTKSLGKNKTTIQDNISVNKKLDTSVKNSNSSLKKFITNLDNGIDTWHKNASGVDKLKVGLTGLVGGTASLISFSNGIKSIHDEGAKFTNVSGSIASGIGTIVSSAMTGASFAGSFGAIAGAIGSGLVLLVNGISSWNSANKDLVKELDNTNFENYKAKIDEITDSYKNNLTSVKQNQDYQLSYLGTLQSLSTELSDLIDTNGKVKEGEEQRANVITTLLNDGLGTQLTLEDGVIKNGKEIISNKEKFVALIDKSIEATKKEILFQNYQSSYKDAIELQTKAKEEYNNELYLEQQNISKNIEKYKKGEINYQELEAIIKQSNSNMQESQNKYNDVINITSNVIDGLKEVTTNYSKKSASDLATAIEKISSVSHQSLEEITKSYANASQEAQNLVLEAKATYDKTNNTYKEPIKLTFDYQDVNTLNSDVLSVYNGLKNACSASIKMSFKADFSGARSEANRFICDYNKSLSNNSANYLPVLKQIPKNALGTVVRKPTLNITGEDGAEAIVPLEKHTEWIDLVSNGISNNLSKFFNYPIKSFNKILSYTQKIANGFLNKITNSNDNNIEVSSNVKASDNPKNNQYASNLDRIRNIKYNQSINDLNYDYLSSLIPKSYTSNLETITNLLEKILSKPADFYIDSKKIAEATANANNTVNGNLMESSERGWIM